MSKLKSVLRYILTIILAIALIILVLVNIAKSTVLSKNYVLNKLDETFYYTKIYGYAKENFKNHIQQSGLDESILDNIITQEQVEEDTKKIITNLYNDISEKITTEEIKQRLTQNIKEATRGMLITTQQQTSIDNFINDICNEYLTSISHFNHEKTIYDIFEKVKNAVELANKVSLITIGVSIVLLILLSLKRKYKIFVNIGIALLSSGLFLVIMNIYINTKINIQSITVLNDAISFTLREILEEVVSPIFNQGLLMLIPGLILIVLFNLIHNYIKENN